MKPSKTTTREKELMYSLKELRKKKIISLNQFDAFLSKVSLVLMELERMRGRLNKLREKE